MRILILGASGYLGNYLYNSLRNSHIVNGTSRRSNDKFIHLDLSSHDQIYEHLSNNEYDCILNTAGNPSPDSCESDYEIAYNSNFLTHYNLINSLLLSSHRPLVIFVSTIYVYGRSRNNIYHDHDPICPSNYYGQVKALAEYAGMQYKTHHTSIRLPLLFGNPLHQIDPISQFLTTEDNLHLDNIEIRYPTSLKHIYNCIEIILKNHLTGTLNISGRTPHTRFSMINRARELLNRSTDKLHSDGIYPDPSLWKKTAYRPKHLKIHQSDIFDMSPSFDEIIIDTYEDAK